MRYVSEKQGDRTGETGKRYGRQDSVRRKILSKNCARRPAAVLTVRMRLKKVFEMSFYSSAGSAALSRQLRMASRRTREVYFAPGS